MEVMTIKTEGARVDRPRNVQRLWLEVLTNSSNGATIQGHWVKGWTKTEDGKQPPVPHRIEVYLDRLDAVLERTQTEKHRQAYAMATESYKGKLAEWKRERSAEIAGKKTDKAREEFIDRNFNIRPETELAAFGYRTGIPPLEYCKVVNPVTGETIDAHEFKKLDAEKRKAFYVDAPATPMNQAQRANEHLAETLERVLSKMARQR